ncbi:HAD family hydrolase [Hydrogenimonas cancrithermarum]|uniref:Haloacid dehalogenase n=1 Tax=Hydrogenimonas cancrithermarum TaxID=2993563 RepID=A0ABN6WRK6_9BACT|nr:haloacid dehalogenase [Hydrogenimonas cancrithermarum]BDY11719.1 hypothetical protein HCR_00310 [Hydrogenimonas cancrithermarum]
MKIAIPSFGTLDIHHIVCDYNGTIARDGELLPEVKPLFESLCESFAIHVVTADTFGSVAEQLEEYDVTIKILSSHDHASEKRSYIESLGAETCVAVGNGNNDMQMLESAALGIALIGFEGCSTQALLKSDIVCTGIEDALELFIHSKRLVATLRV